MKSYFSDVNWVKEGIMLFVFALILGILYLGFLPALISWGFLFCLLVAAVISWIIGFWISTIRYDDASPSNWLFGGIAALTAVFMLVAWIGSGALFNAKAHANTFVPTQVETQAEDIPSFDEVDRVALMDTASAKKLGDRTLGSLSEYVSQFDVSDAYTTISYGGRVVKVAPLVHSSFFTAMKNDTIPGYVIVDCLTSEAKFVKVENGIKYSPSAYFAKDLVRHIRTKYSTQLIGDYYNFQLDEGGKPYWVVTVYDHAVWMSAKVPVGAIVVDATTGDMELYSLENIPEWVEQVFDGDMVSMLYNRHGKYLNGSLNFSDEGKTQVTMDYGYVEKNGDIYIYTGVTSVAADESNLGFIMVNSRTGECKYYPVAGAEEYSAMSAAEGVVQNYGYDASFPSLVMYDDIPTYVMVLKDSNGLVKKYAMVNMVNYTIVAVEDTLDQCKQSYAKAMNGVGKDTVPENAETVKKSIVISSVNFITTNGETVVYIKDTDGVCYKQSFADDETLILLSVGQTVEVEYVATDASIVPAKVHQK